MKCKKCNNELIEYKIGDTIEYICPVCDEAPSTQIDNLIEFDSNEYIVRIIPGNTYEKSMLKAVSRICDCNVLQAKSILENTGFEFGSMDALDTRALKHRLDDARVAYVISPEFRW